MKMKSIDKQIMRATVGLALSIALTLIAFVAISQELATGVWAGALIIVMAAAQFVVQVLLFLHLGDEDKPRWQTQSFAFVGLTALIIVIGSLWIMMNMNYNMDISPEQMEAHMLEQNKKGF